MCAYIANEVGCPPERAAPTCIRSRPPRSCEVIAINGPTYRLKNRLATVGTEVAAAS